MPSCQVAPYLSTHPSVRPVLPFPSGVPESPRNNRSHSFFILSLFSVNSLLEGSQGMINMTPTPQDLVLPGLGQADWDDGKPRSDLL